MKYTKWFAALLVALLVIALPLQAMAAVGDSVIPEDGDISIDVPSGPVEPAEYTVVFKNEDGTVLSSATYKYGDAVTAPTEAPTKAEDDIGTYTFTGWDKEVTVCIGNAVYTATYTTTYKEYTVVFKNDDGSVIETQTLHWGDEISAPIPTKEDTAELSIVITAYAVQMSGFATPAAAWVEAAKLG